MLAGILPVLGRTFYRSHPRMHPYLASSVKKLTSTILSFSLLTVMAGAAVAPALGIIGEHFSDASPLAVKFVVGLPPLFIVLVNLFFDRICRLAGTRTIALTGVLLYVASGAGAFFVDSLPVLLVLRALLGIAVGLVMPLSVGLLAYYYPPEEMSRLMGLSAAMNQAGGVIATLLAGFLAAVSWNFAFLVYLLGLAVAVMVALWLPNERIGVESDASPFAGRIALFRRFHPSVVGMFLCTVAFFAFVSNFALAARSNFSMRAITLVMVGVDIVAAFAGFFFGRIFRWSPRSVKYVPPAFFLLGFAILSFGVGRGGMVAAGALLGFANGIGVPYLNTIASLKGGARSVTTVLPLLSAALFLGQFVCAPLVEAISGMLPVPAKCAVWVAAVFVSFAYLVQTFATRKSQVVFARNAEDSNSPHRKE